MLRKAFFSQNMVISQAPPKTHHSQRNDATYLCNVSSS